MSVFFHKKPHDVEVVIDVIVIDVNGMVTNFYEVVRNPDLFPLPQNMVKATSYSRLLFDEARTINQNPDAFSTLKKAWGFFPSAFALFRLSKTIFKVGFLIIMQLFLLPSLATKVLIDSNSSKFLTVDFIGKTLIIKIIQIDKK